jgi:hypothetical protein
MMRHRGLFFGAEARCGRGAPAARPSESKCRIFMGSWLIAPRAALLFRSETKRMQRGSRRRLRVAEDDPDERMTADDMIAAADGLVEKIRDGWRERGFPPDVLAHSMVGAGLTELTNVRGVEAALHLLRDLLEEIEQAARVGTINIRTFKSTNEWPGLNHVHELPNNPAKV